VSVTEAEMAALIAVLTKPAPTPTRPAREPLTCTVCGQALDAVHVDIGTHPMCDPEPVAAEPPPSTVAELRGILVDYEAGSDRSRQTTIGPSEIGVPCDRRLAYRARGIVGHHDGRVKWAPLQGTAMHVTIAAALTADNARLGRERWLVEQRVWPDAIIRGSCDAYDTDTGMVIDWKLVGTSSLTKYRRHGPGQQYETQAHMYGLGWQRAGRTPRWVRVVFLPRTHDYEAAYEWTAPYSRRTAEAALDRLYRLIQLGHDIGVDTDPAQWAAIPATPGDACRYCPYLRRGGPADDTGCPGDVDGDQARAARFSAGLIPPKE
jgi:hypothetical protein